VVLLNQLVHPVPWSVIRHYRRCGQSCACCRAHNRDDVEWSGCDVCHLGWLMTIVTRWTKECTQQCSKQQPPKQESGTARALAVLARREKDRFFRDFVKRPNFEAPI